LIVSSSKQTKYFVLRKHNSVHNETRNRLPQLRIGDSINAGANTSYLHVHYEARHHIHHHRDEKEDKEPRARAEFSTTAVLAAASSGATRGPATRRIGAGIGVRDISNILAFGIGRFGDLEPGDGGFVSTGDVHDYRAGDGVIHALAQALFVMFTCKPPPLGSSVTVEELI